MSTPNRWKGTPSRPSTFRRLFGGAASNPPGNNKTDDLAGWMSSLKERALGALKRNEELDEETTIEVDYQRRKLHDEEDDTRNSSVAFDQLDHILHNYRSESSANTPFEDRGGVAHSLTSNVLDVREHDDDINSDEGSPPQEQDIFGKGTFAKSVGLDGSDESGQEIGNTKNENVEVDQLNYDGNHDYSDDSDDYEKSDEYDEDEDSSEVDEPSKSSNFQPHDGDAIEILSSDEEGTRPGNISELDEESSESEQDHEQDFDGSEIDDGDKEESDYLEDVQSKQETDLVDSNIHDHNPQSHGISSLFTNSVFYDPLYDNNVADSYDDDLDADIAQDTPDHMVIDEAIMDVPTPVENPDFAVINAAEDTAASTLSDINQLLNHHTYTSFIDESIEDNEEPMGVDDTSTQPNKVSDRLTESSNEKHTKDNNANISAVKGPILEEELLPEEQLESTLPVQEVKADLPTHIDLVKFMPKPIIPQISSLNQISPFGEDYEGQMENYRGMTERASVKMRDINVNFGFGFDIGARNQEPVSSVEKSTAELEQDKLAQEQPNGAESFKAESPAFLNNITTNITIPKDGSDWSVDIQEMAKLASSALAAFSQSDLFLGLKERIEYPDSESDAESEGPFVDEASTIIGKDSREGSVIDGFDENVITILSETVFENSLLEFEGNEGVIWEAEEVIESTKSPPKHAEGFLEIQEDTTSLKRVKTTNIRPYSKKRGAADNNAVEEESAPKRLRHTRNSSVKLKPVDETSTDHPPCIDPPVVEETPTTPSKKSRRKVKHKEEEDALSEDQERSQPETPPTVRLEHPDVSDKQDGPATPTRSSRRKQAASKEVSEDATKEEHETPGDETSLYESKKSREDSGKAETSKRRSTRANTSVTDEEIQQAVEHSAGSKRGGRKAAKKASIPTKATAARSKTAKVTKTASSPKRSSRRTNLNKR